MSIHDNLAFLRFDLVVFVTAVKVIMAVAMVLIEILHTVAQIVLQDLIVQMGNLGHGHILLRQRIQIGTPTTGQGQGVLVRRTNNLFQQGKEARW